MPRIILTVTDEMASDLKTQATRRGATLSGLTRLYIAQGLTAETAKPIERYMVSAGGARRADQRQKREARERWLNEGGQGSDNP